MLIIAVSFGFDGDPFTCSVRAHPRTDASNAEDCLDDICEQQKISREVIDELLIVQNESVVYRYSTMNDDWETNKEDE
jgi:hypothetical protein